VYAEGEDTTLEEYKSKLGLLQKQIEPVLNRLLVKTQVKDTKDTIEKKVNYILTKADSKDCEHIDQKDREEVKKSALTQIKQFDEVFKKYLKHDWTTDFIVDLQSIQNE